MFEESMDNFNVKQDLYFQEQYLADKLIIILGTEENTEQFISMLSKLFKDKHFSTQLGSEELC